ncbi:MAG TPA: peptide ABC transporter substrate-binding protein [Aliidongia sp.]|nr:peptide ABC transporter substrate-binding protein [Aliidongia sp.]
MKRSRIAGAGFLALIVVFLFSTMASAETVLRRGNAAEPGGLDPQAFDTTIQARIEADLYEGLTAPAPGGKIAPGQAESWTVSPDGKIWNFTLKPNLKWSNGDPVTADDFVYSLRRLVNPANGFLTTFLAEPILNAMEIIRGQEKDVTKLGVEAPDPRTVRITLAAPNAALPEMLVPLRPVHRGSVEALGKEAFKPGNMVSNGAYELVEWRPQALISVVRNPNYWDAGHVQIDRVEYYPVEDQNEELKRYRAGDLDMTADVPKDQLDFIERTLGDQYKQAPYLGIYFIGFNNSRPPFKDNPKLREALTLAINRETLIEKIIRGGAQPAYGWIPHTIAGYPNASFPNAALSQSAREDLARKLYAEAGYSAQHPAEFELLYNTSENHKKIMIAVAAMWKKVLGADARLHNEEFRVFIDNRLSKKATEAYRGGFIAPYTDPQPLLELLRTGSGFNDMAYSNPRFDTLFAQAGRTPDPAERLKLFADAEALALADFPAAPIYYYSAERLIKPYVTGWQPSPRDSFRSQDLSIAAH